MSNLSKLPNIGNTLEEKLNQVDIFTFEELKNVGSENTIIRIKTINHSGVCLNMLYALEGAIQGIRWHNLAFDRKAELKDFFNLLKSERAEDRN